MTRASRWLRRIEISLWIVGISLCGVALEATVDRWQYQEQQERALFTADLPQNSIVPEIAADPDTIENASGSVQDVVTAGPDRPSEELPGSLAAPRIDEQPVDPPRKERSKRREPVVDPTALGRIEIPRLGLTAIVREGVDDETLARAVGLVPGTAKPGEYGNMVLAGHRDTFFRPLRKIEIDDVIRMVVPPHTYEYRVASLRVVAPTETSVLDSNGIDELTLVTCYPFRFLGPAPDRYIVSATRID